MLAGNNISILTDESTVVDDKLKITGLHDYRVSTSIVPLQALSVDNDKYYSILIDQKPRRMDAGAEAGYDMYPAGNNHAADV